MKGGRQEGRNEEEKKKKYSVPFYSIPQPVTFTSHIMHSLSLINEAPENISIHEPHTHSSTIINGNGVNESVRPYSVVSPAAHQIDSKMQETWFFLLHLLTNI